MARKANTNIRVVSILTDGDTRAKDFESDLRGAKDYYTEEADGDDVLAVLLLRPSTHGSYEMARATTRG